MKGDPVQIPAPYYENVDAVPKSSGSTAVNEATNNETDDPRTVSEPYVNIGVIDNKTKKNEEESVDSSQTLIDGEHYQKLQITDNTNINSAYDQLY